MTLQRLEAALTHRPLSPLFARLASEYLDAGRIEDAKKLCLSGLQRFPRYPTGHFVLAKCFAAEQRYSAALDQLGLVLGILPDSVVLRVLHTQWNEFAAKALQPIQEESLSTDLPRPISEHAATEEPPEAQFEAIADVVPRSPGIPAATIVSSNVTGIDLTPELPSQELQQETRPSDVLDQETGRIVTKTLAEIYAMQSAFGEAILTYQLLKKKRPEQIGEIDRRINELEAKRQAR